MYMFECVDEPAATDMSLVDITDEHFEAVPEEDENAMTLYIPVVYEKLRRCESLYALNENFLEQVQSDVTHQMRTILVDWLVEGKSRIESSFYRILYLSHDLLLLRITPPFVTAQFWWLIFCSSSPLSLLAPRFSSCGRIPFEEPDSLPHH